MCSHQVLTGASNGGRGSGGGEGRRELPLQSKSEHPPLQRTNLQRTRPHLSFTPPGGRVHSLLVGRKSPWQQIQTQPSPQQANMKLHTDGLFASGSYYSTYQVQLSTKNYKARQRQRIKELRNSGVSSHIIHYITE